MQPFEGAAHVQKIRCSGETLPSDAELMSMVMYQAFDQRVLSVLNLNKQQCSTSAEFVSCAVDKLESKKSSVTVLVSDLQEGQWRAYGCNVSVLFPATGKNDIFSWSVTVRRHSKSCVEEEGRVGFACVGETC